MKKHKKYLLSGLSIFLIIIISIMLYSNFNLGKELNSITGSTIKLEKNFDLMKKNFESLKQENLQLKKQNKQVKEESTLVSGEAERVEEQVEKTMDRLDSFERTVTNSIDWFRENNNIAGIEEYSEITQELEDNCLRFNESCQIDLTCLYEVNKKNRFRYSFDEYSTGKKDFLKDLKKIYSQQGGDCEDFSLLIQAEYNYLVDQCLENYSRSEIDPIVDNNVRGEIIEKSIKGTYMSIICGNFDPGGIVQNYAGHCLVALTENQILKSSDVYKNIKESILVEPQNGRYVANMSNTDIITIFDNGVPPDTFHDVDLVITEDDLIIFDEYADEIEWIGYKDFLEKIESLKKEVEK